MTCAVTTSILGCLVTLLLFGRYVSWLDISVIAKGFVFVLCVLAGCLPLLVGYNFEPLLGKFYGLYRYTLYFIYIAAVILLTVTLFGDFLWGCVVQISRWSGQAKSFWPCSKTFCLWYHVSLIIIALICSGYALYAGIKVPEIKEVFLQNEKITTPKTVVVLSDLHIHRTICPNKIKEIVAKTNAQNPDIILLAGDIIDDDTSKVHDITNLLEDLKAKDGVYFITGNHEFYAGYKETVAELKQLGFTFLENNGHAVSDNIFLAGIPDYFSAPSHEIAIDIKKAFSESLAKNYKILISHTPVDFGINDKLFDLEISGHTHGGQIFPFHILTKLYNKYLSGLYNLSGNAQIYVSRGAGQWGPQMRFLAPSEITVLKLQPQK